MDLETQVQNLEEAVCISLQANVIEKGLNPFVIPEILFENPTIIAHEIDKLRLQILEALHIKTKNLTSVELTLKIVTMF